MSTTSDPHPAVEPTPEPSGPERPALIAPASTPAKSRGPKYWPWYLAAIVLALFVTAGAWAATNRDSAVETAAPTTTPTTNAETATAAADDTGSAATVNTTPPALLLDARAVGEKVIPSVVTVNLRGATVSGTETEVGSGSGVIYDTDGHVITNNHVATAGSSYEVVLSDGRIYPAEVVGTDPETDLAVLKISAKDLVPITLGNTDGLTVGDPTVAVGSPLGLSGGPSLTVGVLSAFDRMVQTDSVTQLHGMLQTDAPITSGSSGGALVNSDGELIGITTAVGVSAVGVEGIGFATPVEIVNRVADEIIAGGEASIPYLGIYIQIAMEDTDDGGSSPIGIGIESVVDGLAADEAGLVGGDVITKLNGVPVHSNTDLIGQLRRYSVGATIEVTLHDGRVVDVTLGQRPDDL